MVMMDRRVVDGTRMRQAKGIDGEDTNERHPRVALLTIPSGDILIEGDGVVEHAIHGRRGARVPARYVVVEGVVCGAVYSHNVIRTPVSNLTSEQVRKTLSLIHI